MAQRAIALLPFMPANSTLFSPCGTMFFFLFTRDMAHQGASELTRETTHVDQVDFVPLDLDHTHVNILQPSISLMKSDGRDLIAHSANHGATRGHIRTLS